MFSLKASVTPSRRDSFQITTDGFAPYRTAIPDTLRRLRGLRYAHQGLPRRPEGERGTPRRSRQRGGSPSHAASPIPKRICTSIVERQNLSCRMGTRRFTRLTNAFSKKWENHWAAVSLWYTFYNFCRIHKSLRVTPAMAAGITDHVWDVRELLEAA